MTTKRGIRIWEQREPNNRMTFLIIVLYTLAGLLSYEILRRLPKTSLIFFSIAPILLTAWWIYAAKGDAHDWISWMKVYTIACLACLVVVMRFFKVFPKKLGFLGVYCLVILNISEIVIKCSIPPVSIPTILVGIAGVFLVFTLPTPRAMAIQEEGPHDFLYEMPYAWIFGYTIWDFGFVLLLFPTLLANQTAMLLAPLIVALWNNKLYFQSRVISLAFYMMMGFTSPFFIDLGTISPWNNALYEWGIAIISLAWTGSHFISKRMN